MAMVSADGSSQSFGGLTAQISWFGLRVGGHQALSLHSSNEPGELSQWLCHDDNTINIVVDIILYIIIIINVKNSDHIITLTANKCEEFLLLLSLQHLGLLWHLGHISRPTNVSSLLVRTTSRSREVMVSVSSQSRALTSRMSWLVSIPVSAYWHYQPHCIYWPCYQHLLDLCRLVLLAVPATLSVFCQWPPVAIGPTFRNFRGVFRCCWVLSAKHLSAAFTIHSAVSIPFSIVLLGYLPCVIVA